MTFQEILKSVEFDDMVDALINMDSEVADNLYSFKEAYDLLCMMKPEKENNIPITVEQEIDPIFDSTSLDSNIEREGRLESMLSRPIVIDENCNATMPEIAATLFWNINFFYEIEYHNLPSMKQIGVTNPYKREYLKLKQEIILTCKTRKNGPKRHREKKLLLKTNALERKMENWEILFGLKLKNTLDNLISKILYDEIIDGNTFHQYYEESDFSHYYMESRTKDGKDIEYITELIRDYFPTKYGSKSLVLVSAPEKLSCGKDLKYSIWNVFGSFRKIPKPEYIFGIDNNRKNIRVDILVFD